MTQSNETIRISAAANTKLTQNAIRRKLGATKETIAEPSNTIRDSLETSDRDSSGQTNLQVERDADPQKKEDSGTGGILDVLG